MRSKVLYYIFIISLFFGCKTTEATKETTTQPKPNVVFILADDLGYGDLSCYGQQKFNTPNIDKLAAEGMLFTQHYSGATVCAPSRSAFLTGQHTGHTMIRGNKEARPEGQFPLADSVFTMAELFQKEGYATGAFGKWGLGFPGSEGDPNNQGFDTFVGYNCQRLAHHYYPYHLWENDQKIMLKGNEGKAKEEYAPEIIHEKAITFIKENKDKPFFMFYPSALPHAELVAPEEYMEKHRGKYLPEKEYKGYDEGERYREGPYESQKEPHAAFAAMINVLDDQVGDIVKTLEELGIADNTIIIFTSDNGPHKEGGADPDYFNSNGIYRGYKRDLYEGGIRVPLIVKWNNKIKKGSQTDLVSAFWDFIPTFSELLATDTKDFDALDGVSFYPTLMGSDDQEQHDFLYWEFHEKGGRQALRKGKWKAIRYNVFKNRKSIPQLYNLEDDPEEKKNIASTYPEIAEAMSKIMENARTESTVFNFGQKTHSPSK
ncbi:arylsulfatase [Flammeovirga sp. OC4]|uniref:arylsulfatase n=1 Tax=Flammeovirga sp. OC4 TaxID=1382345 RepID=UPI0006950A40|nr:arylsulfatase [Flammeovirga sp. OC4]